MRSSMGKMFCSFEVAARRELAVVASMAVAVAAAALEEHAVEVDKIVDVVAKLGGFVLEMVPRHNFCDLLAAVDTIEEVRSAVGFGCNMLRLGLPCQAFEGVVPWEMVDIAGDSEADWEGSRMVPASDLVTVGSSVGWMLVEVLGRCAVGVDRR